MRGAIGDERARYILFVAAVLALGLSLRAAALGGGLLADDYDHYAMVSGIYPVARSPLDLFDFIGRAPVERWALLNAGRLPWWSDPAIELSVMRPLASALIEFDYHVLGGVPLCMHLHSMLWWVVLVCGVAALLYELLPAPLAALALLLYALDEAHGLPLAWLANRSALVAVAFLTWGLWAHVAARTRRLRGGAFLSALFVGLGLLAGEHAVAPLAYFASFELLGMRDAARVRLRALLPVAILAAGYAALHQALGYAIAGSGYYIDPMRTPVRYLVACASRMPLLLGDLGFGFGAEWHAGGPPFLPRLLRMQLVPDAWLALDHLRRFQFGLGVTAGLSIIVMIVRLRRSARVEAPAVRWLVAGALFALLPVCGTLPMTRLTLAAAIGADVALAFIMLAALRAVRHARPVGTRLAAAALLLALLGVHAVWAGVRAHGDVDFFARIARVERSEVLNAEIDDSLIAKQDVMLIAAVDWATQWALPAVLHLNGRPRPHSSHLLSGALLHPHVLHRRSDHVLDIEMRGDAVDATFAGSVYRPSTPPFVGGEQRELPPFRVEVLSAKQGQPSSLRFMFVKSLDDPTLLFLYPGVHGLARVKIPPLGERLSLPPPASAAPR
jgi:hypothetical protein